MSRDLPETSPDDQAKVTMVDILALPDELRTLATGLIRLREAGLSEIAAYLRLDESSAYGLLATLIKQGFAQELQSRSGGQPHYCIRLAARRGSTLPHDLL